MIASDLAQFYPSLALRIAIVDQTIRTVVGRMHIRDRWVRDLPATVLQMPPTGAPEPDVLWTGGFRLRHNRYVRRGAFPAYHLSDGITTVAAEVFGVAPQIAPVLGVPSESRLQLVVDADVPGVLDLTAQSVRRELGVSTADLVGIPDWTVLDALGRPAAYELPQCIGEVAYHAGLAGVLYRAARATGGTNLVVFTDHLARVGGSLRATNPFTGTERRLP